jgi:3-oxoacyl-[acyl-carrier-protein] synthase III
MAFLTVENIRISGVAACVPKAVESNLDYDYISAIERKFLIKTTGITNRRVAPDGMCTSDMCFAAAERLLADLKIEKTAVEALIFVSQSPDYYLPATSIILQDRLGLSKATLAFDIQLGCSGYVYGLSVIGNLMNSGKLKNALLLVGDKSSFSQSKKDKSTYPIFGDAGTATLLTYDEKASPLYFNLQSDGSGYQAIIIPDGGVRNPMNEKSSVMEKVGEGIERSRRNLWLDGIEVFNFSVREAPANVLNLMQHFNLTLEEVDYFVMHQANQLMNESIRKKLGFAPEKIPYSLHNYGNTSSASIPLTMVTQLRQQLTNNSVNLLFSAFGVGLSWGSLYAANQQIYCAELLEI